MNLILEINNLDSCNFNQKKLELTVIETIKQAELVILLKKDVLVSIGLISESEIKKINKKYRNKNSSTDILSFGNFNSKEELINQSEENIFLGELLVCPADIKKYCQEKNIEFEKEFFKVVSHGMLHLVGFRHGKKMFEIQKDVANKISKNSLK
ncbi:MAG: rRNA maturation RNase YbeY [Parcubacteria group bacterium]|jgi:probable rRNA maturation factor